MSMRSTFGGFEIAKSGIFISQQALNLTGHNITNAETAGYTRQRIDTASIDPYTSMGKFAPMSATIYGQGVRSMQVAQIRDSFLDRQFRTSYTQTNYWNTRYGALDQIQGLYDTSADYDISNLMQEYFKSLTELSKAPADLSVRTAVREQAKLMTEVIRNQYESLIEKQTEQNEAVKVNEDQINEISKSLAELNKQIYGFELTGQPANDLRDKRNLLLDELSGYVDITYSNDADGRLNVYLGGEALVSHSSYNELEAVDDVTNPIAGEDSLYSVKWKTGPNQGNAATISGGELKAHLDLRDGTTTDNIGIPYYVNKLNQLANSLATEVNKLHSGGWTYPYTENGVDYDSQQGVLFFQQTVDNSTTPPTYTPITAKDFYVSDAVLESEEKIAASTEEIDLTAENQLVGNGNLALALSELITNTALDNAASTGVSSFQSFYRSYTTEIGLNAQTAERQLENYYAVVQAHDNNRVSVSGVSLDEEMTNLIKYQHSYSAASRALTTLDDALDVLINRTGRVGL